MTRKRLWLIALVGLMGGNVLCASGEEWKSVFADDFNRSDVFGPDWVIKDGKWDLKSNLKANSPAVIMCTRRFETPFRIEYECYSDNPGDLSIELRKKLDEGSVCFVGFGVMNNTLNKIDVPGEGAVATSREKLIEVGRKYKVAVEVGEDGLVKQTIDGQETLKATVKTLPKKLYFGFYVWSQGVFNSVKVLSPKTGEAAPDKKTTGAVENIPMVREFKSFNDYPVGTITDVNIKAESGEKCSAKIADVPTWLYYNVKTEYRNYRENEDPAKADAIMKGATNKGAHFVADPCVELLDENADAGKQAMITFPVPEMKKGLIEFDLMADYYGSDGLKIRLGNKAGIWVNKDGDYYWQAGTNSIRLMERVTLDPLAHGTARVYLRSQRWFTFRIDYDLETSLANVTIVRMFNGSVYPPTRYMLVGEDLPLPTDTVKEVRFETCGTGRFLVDNLFMISRTPDLSDDLKWRVPAREMMTAYYPLRKDPLDLKYFSMRNIRHQAGSGTPTGDELMDLLKFPERYAVILGCAEKYNRIMIRQAFIGEKMRGLERAWIYGEKTAGEYKAKIEEARQAAAKTEKLLADLYEFYGECYLDRLNQEKMQGGFDKRYADLNTAIETAESVLQNTLDGMRTEVIKKSQCKFSPYPIESVDATSVKLKFSDGAFRRPDGKRDFIFEGGNFLWPSMENILQFSPIDSLGMEHALRGTKEPEYCNDTTNTWFYHCLAGVRPDEQVSLKLFHGLHNHRSILPTWWVEKHKNDPDIFLQNSKGQTHLEEKDANPDSPPMWQQFNYWNPEVLAAQKAVFEGYGDLMVKYGFGERVSFLTMAQEAYFLIPGPGGTWETGYNKSAVKAFREVLQKKYGSIGVLNERWGSKYGSFEEIQPPEDWRVKPERVPGLTCEFERFRQDSWHQWLKQSHIWLKNRLPGKNVPNSCDISATGDLCIDGLDLVKLYETFDFVMEHYENSFADNPARYRYFENLREVYKTSTGIGEWGPFGPGDLFNEEGVRDNTLRQFYQNVQWGRSMLSIWARHDFGSGPSLSCNITDTRLGNTVFRFQASFIPLGIARAEAHRAIYQECPLIQPDIGILESESSFYNAWDPRGGLREFSGLLFRKGHDYGYVFERPIMEGRQNLDNYKVIIMPNAACLPDKFAEKLLGWVKAGGILLTTGPAGVMNELGVKGGKLPDEVLGSGQWTYEKGKLSVKDGIPGLTVLALDSSKQPALIEKECGKGKVYMRLNPVKEEATYEIISRHAPRKFYGKDNRFHLAMREGKEKELYLSVLNPECFKQLEDEIVLEGEYKTIADISCNFPILPEIRDGKTSFKLSLAPAEGIIIRIQK